MVDYFSQVFLRKFHQDILYILKTLPQDRTFTQSPRNLWNDNNHNFHSLDLTAATDRFPLSLQVKIIRILYDCEINNDFNGF